MRVRFIFKFFSFFIALIHFLTACVFAYAPEANVWNERKKMPPIIGQSFLVPNSVSPFRGSTSTKVGTKLLLKSLVGSLPDADGTFRCIRVPQKFDSGKIVIHIQDVHKNVEAQRNIARAVKDLLNKNDIDLLALEGAFTPINLRPFKQFPHPDIVQEVADCLLRNNQISGAAYAMLESSKAIPPIVGVDDRRHYDANVRAYRRSTELTPSLERRVEGVEKKISLRKIETFNSDLAAFDAQVQAYRKGDLKIGKYLEILAEQRSSPIPFNVERFRAALRLEETLNFPEVEVERTRLLGKLATKLNLRELTDLNNTSLAYRRGDVAHTDFYLALCTICESHKIWLSDYPAVAAYLRYVLLFDSLDVETILEEIAGMEEVTYAWLARSRDEKELIAESKRLFLVRKLMNFSLTKKEWRDYKAFGQIQQISADLQPFDNFYEQAEIRDQRMADNLIRAMKRTEARIAILVTGGFHSEGIDAVLSDSGIASITFVPKVTKIETGKNSVYLSLFSQEKTPLEKLFQEQKLFLADSPFDFSSLIGGILGLHRAVYESSEGPLHEENFSRSVGLESVEIDVNEKNRSVVSLAAGGASSRVLIRQDRLGNLAEVRLAKSWLSRFIERKDEILYPWFQEKWNILSWSYAVAGHHPRNPAEWHQLAGNYLMIWILIISFAALPAFYSSGFRNTEIFIAHFLCWLLPALFIGVFPAHFIVSVVAVSLGLRSPTKPKSMPIIDLRNDIPGSDPDLYFGKNFCPWLQSQISHGKTSVRVETAKRMAEENSGFWSKLDETDEDTGLAVIQYAAENSLNLGTQSLRDFIAELRRHASAQQRKRLMDIKMTLLNFVRLRLIIIHPIISSYLSSAQFRNLNSEDKLQALVSKIKESKLPLGSDHLAQIHSGLPSKLPGDVLKSDIQMVSLSMQEAEQVSKGLDAIRDYLGSSEFKDLDAEDKLAALVKKIKDKKMPLQSTRLSSIYTALPLQLPGGVLKRDIRRVNLSMTVFSQLREALEAIRDYLSSSDFIDLSAEDKLAALVGKIKEKKLPLESSSLAQVHTALPPRLPGGVPKHDIKVVALSMKVFDQVRAGLQSIREYLSSSEFKELNAEDKLMALVAKIKEKGQLESNNLAQIYSALPFCLPGGVFKRDILKVNFPIPVFKQVRTGLESIKEYLGSFEFENLDAEDKLAALVAKIKEKGKLDSDNLGHIYSALPVRLPGGVLKSDIKSVALPMRTYDQVRRGLEAIQDYVASSEFKDLDAEDKLAALVTKIKEKGKLDSDNLGHIYSALPVLLPGGVLKSDIQKVDFPIEVFDQVRKGLEAIKTYLSSANFKKLSAEDKLAALVAKIKEKSPLDSDNLGQIYMALPFRLPGDVSKRDIIRVQLPIFVFEQVRTGLVAIQGYLGSSEFKSLEAEDKLAALVAKIKEKRKLESDNLKHIHAALPFQLPGGVFKRDIASVNLPIWLFDQVRALLKEESWVQFMRAQIAIGLFGAKLAKRWVEELGKKSPNVVFPVSGLITAFPAWLKRSEIPARLKMRVWNSRTETTERAIEDTVDSSVTGNELHRLVDQIIGAMNERDSKIARAILDSESEEELISDGYSLPEVERVRVILREKLSESGYSPVEQRSATKISTLKGKPGKNSNKRRGAFSGEMWIIFTALTSVVGLAIMASSAYQIPLPTVFELAKAFISAAILAWPLGLLFDIPRTVRSGTLNRTYKTENTLAAAILKDAPLNMGLSDLGNDAVLVVALDKPINDRMMKKLVDNLKEISTSAPGIPILIVTTAAGVFRREADGTVILDMGQVKTLLAKEPYFGRVPILAMREGLKIDWRNAKTLEKSLLVFFENQLKVIVSTQRTFNEAYRKERKVLSSA